jgi:hypothetical protein
MAVRLSALRAGHPLPPGRFLVLISVRGWVDPRVIVRLEPLGQLKKIHLIETRTRDLPACSTVPQPTMLSRAPMNWHSFMNFTNFHIIWQSNWDQMSCRTLSYSINRADTLKHITVSSLEVHTTLHPFSLSPLLLPFPLPCAWFMEYPVQDELRPG